MEEVYVQMKKMNIMSILKLMGMYGEAEKSNFKLPFFSSLKHLIVEEY